MAEMGPMARFVEDLELVLRRAGAAERARSRRRGGRLASGGRGAKPRVAVFEEDGLQPVAGVCRDAVRRAAAALEAAGYEVVEDRPPNAAAVRQTYDLILATDLAVMMLPQVEGMEELLAPFMQEHGRGAPQLPRVLGAVRGGVPSAGRAGAAGGRVAGGASGGALTGDAGHRAAP